MIEELARQIPGIEKMLKSKGVGLVTAAGFVAEVGDIHRFEHAKQIQKLAGLNLKEIARVNTKAEPQSASAEEGVCERYCFKG